MTESELLDRITVVGRTALETVLGAAEAKARNGLAGALEEDARLTALFLWTLQATTADGTREADAPDADAAGDETDEDAADTSAGKAKGFSLVFDVVRRFAQPLGIDLEKWERRTIETKKGIVRLLPVAERAARLFGRRDSQARRIVARAAGGDRDGSSPGSALFRPARWPAGCCPGTPTAVRRRRSWRQSFRRRPRRHDPRPRPYRDAAPGRRAHERAAGAGSRGAATEPRLPASGQRSVRALSAGQ